METFPALSSVSLFSGCGGMDYGIEATGFTTCVANEIDPVCCQTLRQNRSWPVIERDIFEVSTDELLAIGRLRRRDYALLIGGPPCQPFSKAGFWATGQSRRLNDPRADTLSAYLRVLRESLPAAFILENVAGLAFLGKDEGLRLLLNEIQRINRAEGTRYRPAWKVIRAVEHGVPQIRERLFLVAFRDGAEFAFPPPTFSAESHCDAFGSLPSPRTAWDALGDLPEPLEGFGELKVSGKWAALLPTIPEGHNYLWHTDRMGGEPIFGWRRRFWNFLLKLAKDRPAWTIAAQPGPATGPFHWRNRRLSMRELARLQTFPDNVEVVGDLRAVQRQVGNAVPSLLAEMVGRRVFNILCGRKQDSPPKLLPPDRSPTPPRERITRVATRFLSLRFTELEHPGTGKGPGAVRRKAKSAA